MFNIRKAGELRNVMALKTLIYGQPGIGKTSLSCTASRPILLDCDRGSHRSAFSTNVAVPEGVEMWDWSTFLYFAHNPNEWNAHEYDTIIIDTIDSMLARCIDFIRLNECTYFGCNKSGQLYNVKQGTLSLQGYGTLKAQFKIFIEQIYKLGKDLVMIAHEKKESEGEKRIIPAITGGSFNEVLAVSDLIGYYSHKNGERVLTFQPNETSFGKDAGGIGIVNVPLFTESPDYFAELLSKAKQTMNDFAKAQKEAMDKIRNLRVLIANIKDAMSANSFSEIIKLETEQVKVVIRNEFITKCNSLGLVFNKESKKYEDGAIQE